MSILFNASQLKQLYTPPPNSSGEDNGQVTIIGGSELFHGAPLLTLTIASRIVDMVFFASPYKPLQEIVDTIKSKLFSFIWIPWNDIEKYIEKSDAILIGPGMMRWKSDPTSPRLRGAGKFDSTGRKTRRIVERLLHEYAHKKWVIDAGALQTMKASWIPKGSIITPNKKEFKMLFGVEFNNFNLNEMEKMVEIMAQKHECIIVLKGPITYVSDGRETIRIEGGNAGLTKGGTGDVLAGLTVALLAKNSPMLASTSASYIIKKAADEMFAEVGTYYNADEVSKKIPEVLWKVIL